MITQDASGKVEVRTSTLHLILAAIALAAVAVHGYQLGVDDGAIYVPAIKKAADPTLYALNEAFFTSHARLSLFPDLVGGFARVTRLPVDWAILGCHILGVFLLLESGWMLAVTLFEHSEAAWAGVALLAGTLTVPVAGTALVVMDPYVTARSLSTPAALFAVAYCLAGKRRLSMIWLIATALIHPQMSVYALALVLIIEWSFTRGSVRKTSFAGFAGLPIQFDFTPATGPAREALLSRSYFFLFRWEWYEWIGVVAPVGLLWWLGGRRLRATRNAVPRLARSLVIFGTLFTLAAIVVSSSSRLENFTRLQPMRAFHLIYAIFFIILGGLAGEYLLRRVWWRWAALFLPLAGGMWMLAVSTYPHSGHIEIPGSRNANPWVSAFAWVRFNTPKDAVFALDADYMKAPGEDLHGFRAIAERSQVADRVKDSGVVSLFPGLASEWQREVKATEDLTRIDKSGIERLERDFGVTWVLSSKAVAGAACPYAKSGIFVCRLR